MQISNVHAALLGLQQRVYQSAPVPAKSASQADFGPAVIKTITARTGGLDPQSGMDAKIGKTQPPNDGASYWSIPVTLSPSHTDDGKAQGLATGHG